MLALTNSFGSESSVAHLEAGATRGESRGVVGWLVRAVVAIHLLPALGVVLVVGGVGLCVLGGVRLLNRLASPAVG